MRNEGGDLLSVLDELNPGALADSGVWLLGLNSDLLDHDSLGVRATSKWLLPLGSDVRLLVVLIGPQLRLPVQAELTSGSKSTRFTVLGFLKNNNNDNDDREVGNRRGQHRASNKETRERARETSLSRDPAGATVARNRAKRRRRPCLPYRNTRRPFSTRSQETTTNGVPWSGCAPRLSAIPAPNTVGRPVGLGVRPVSTSERAAFKLTPCLQCLL